MCNTASTNRQKKPLLEDRHFCRFIRRARQIRIQAQLLQFLSQTLMFSQAILFHHFLKRYRLLVIYLAYRLNLPFMLSADQQMPFCGFQLFNKQGKRETTVISPDYIL